MAVFNCTQNISKESSLYPSKQMLMIKIHKTLNCHYVSMHVFYAHSILCIEIRGVSKAIYKVKCS